MGSVSFDIEDQSQPSTSNSKKYKLARTVKLRDDGGAVRRASFPRKIRSATKKQNRESFIPPLPVIRKQRHGFELRKDGAKKLTPNMKLENISKDEEEVAETLFSLADMFGHENKANLLPGIKNETPETIYKVEDMVGSAGEMLKNESVYDAQHQQVSVSELPATSNASRNQSESLSSRSRASNSPMIPSAEQVISMEQVAASRVQHDKNYCPMDDKNNSFFMSHRRSKTPELCLRLPEIQKSSASQPLLVWNSGTGVKNNQTPDPIESKKSWKRCPTHVYISSLIKVLQASETKGASLENLIQTTQLGTDNQTTWIAGRASSAFTHFASARIKNDISWHGRPLRDHHLSFENSASCSTTNQGYDFLSLGSGVSDFDTNEGTNHDTPKQSQSQRPVDMVFSLPQHGYSSTFHTQDSALAANRVQHSQNPGSTLQQQKWTSQAELPTQYTNGEIIAPKLLDWKVAARASQSTLYAHTLFPNLHDVLNSKSQQFSYPQQQLLTINSSQLPHLELKKRHHPYLSLELKRNEAAIYPENMPQLQLPCYQHLSS